MLLNLSQKSLSFILSIKTMLVVITALLKDFIVLVLHQRMREREIRKIFQILEMIFVISSRDLQPHTASRIFKIRILFTTDNYIHSRTIFNIVHPKTPKQSCLRPQLPFFLYSSISRCTAESLFLIFITDSQQLQSRFSSATAKLSKKYQLQNPISFNTIEFWATISWQTRTWNYKQVNKDIIIQKYQASNF